MTHFFVKFGINTRSNGGSALRCSAYQRCAPDPDFDFSKKSEELVSSGVMLPDGAHPEPLDPVTLWTEVETWKTERDWKFDIQKEIEVLAAEIEALKKEVKNEPEKAKPANKTEAKRVFLE